jgi:hypothetical protein
LSEDGDGSLLRVIDHGQIKEDHRHAARVDLHPEPTRHPDRRQRTGDRDPELGALADGRNPPAGLAGLSSAAEHRCPHCGQLRTIGYGTKPYRLRAVFGTVALAGSCAVVAAAAISSSRSMRCCRRPAQSGPPPAWSRRGSWRPPPGPLPWRRGFHDRLLGDQRGFNGWGTCHRPDAARNGGEQHEPEQPGHDRVTLEEAPESAPAGVNLWARGFRGCIQCILGYHGSDGSFRIAGLGMALPCPATSSIRCRPWRRWSQFASWPSVHPYGKIRTVQQGRASRVQDPISHPLPLSTGSRDDGSLLVIPQSPAAGASPTPRCRPPLPWRPGKTSES